MIAALALRLQRLSCRRPWATVAACLLLAAASAWFAAATLKIHTDPDALFEEGLPFKRAEAAYEKLFPGEQDLIVAVVTAKSVAAAERAAERLAARLARESGRFLSVRQPTGGTFFKRHGLLYLSVEELNKVAETLAAAQPLLGTLTADPSARGLFKLLTLAFDGLRAGEGKPGSIATVIEAVAQATNDTLAGRPAAIDWATLFGDLGGEGRAPRAFVLVQAKRDLSALEQGAGATKFIRQAAAEIGLTPERGYRVRLTGSIPLTDEEFATVAEGTGFAGILSALLVLGLLFVGLRSVKMVFATMVVLVLGMAITGGWAALSIGELNLISVAFAVMFVGIAVDFSIQFCLRLREERYVTRDPARASEHAAATMAAPLALAAVATAIGFFSFLPTSYRGVAELGVIAGGGMIVAVALTFTLLPALLAILKPRGEEAPVGYAWARRPNAWLLRRRRLVVLAAGLFTALTLAATWRLDFDFDPLKLKDRNTESMATLLELFGDPWATPNTLNLLAADGLRARELAARFATVKEVRQALTIFDFVPEKQAEKLAILDETSLQLLPSLRPPADPPAPGAAETAAAVRALKAAIAAYAAAPGADAKVKAAAAKLAAALDALPAAPSPALVQALDRALVGGFEAERAALAEALSAKEVTLAALPDDLKKSWIALDGRYRVQLFPAEAGAAVDSLDRFLAAVRAVAPEAVGPPVNIVETGKIVVRAFAVAAGLAVAAITLLLFVTMRRPADVVRTLAPLLAAAIWTLGLCALAGLSINFANIIGLPLLLGIGVTFPIYIVSAWRMGEASLLSSPMARGMLFSALTTAAAFGSLALSSHPGTASMGLLLTLALVLTLVATLVVLPALLGPPRARSA